MFISESTQTLFPVNPSSDFLTGMTKQKRMTLIEWKWNINGRMDNGKGKWNEMVTPNGMEESTNGSQQLEQTN